MRTIIIPIVAVLIGCSDPDRTHILTGEAMGTTYRIKSVQPAESTHPAIRDMLAGLDRDLSTWQDDSWLATFNRAEAGTTLEMPASVARLLELSKKIHAKTDGRFDPTIGALIRIWGFGSWRNEWQKPPSEDALEAARQACGFHLVQIEGNKITKRRSGLMLDFSAIAKGYAVDRMGELLHQAGCHDFIIEFGGDILASGNRPGGNGWIVGGPAIGKPQVLHNEAVASSGSEYQHREGRSHVIDPLSGRPLAVGAPVSATAPTCAEADALATAVLVASGSPVD